MGDLSPSVGDDRHVRFGELVHVREIPLVRTAQVNAGAFRGRAVASPSHAHFATSLSWEVAREYDTPLHAISYDTPPTSQLPQPAAAGGLASPTPGGAGATLSHAVGRAGVARPTSGGAARPSSGGALRATAAAASGAAVAAPHGGANARSGFAAAAAVLGGGLGGEAYALHGEGAALQHHHHHHHHHQHHNHATTGTAAPPAAPSQAAALLLTSPRGAAAPAASVAPTASAAAHAEPSKIIESWHVKADGCVYQGPVEHSSPVASVQGNVVTTRSGSRYTLGRLDERVAAVLELVAPGAFDPLDPLAPELRTRLLYAERVAYGAAAAPLAALASALAAAEAALQFPELVSPQFESVRQILSTLGLRHQ